MQNIKKKELFLLMVNKLKIDIKVNAAAVQEAQFNKDKV
jgi:hypothetical protein